MTLFKEEQSDIFFQVKLFLEHTMYSGQKAGFFFLFFTCVSMTYPLYMLHRNTDELDKAVNPGQRGSENMVLKV